jgi:hypothetical protein
MPVIDSGWVNQTGIQQGRVEDHYTFLGLEERRALCIYEVSKETGGDGIRACDCPWPLDDFLGSSVTVR